MLFMWRDARSHNCGKQGQKPEPVHRLKAILIAQTFLLNPKVYTGKATINTEVEGKPERMDISQAGKWLSDDCGNIKPSRR
jgi:hypothetical protein